MQSFGIIKIVASILFHSLLTLSGIHSISACLYLNVCTQTTQLTRRYSIMKKLSIKQQLYTELQEIAHERGKTLDILVAEIIEKWLEEHRLLDHLGNIIDKFCEIRNIKEELKDAKD